MSPDRPDDDKATLGESGERPPDQVAPVTVPPGGPRAHSPAPPAARDTRAESAERALPATAPYEPRDAGAAPSTRAEGEGACDGPDPGAPPTRLPGPGEHDERIGRF